jgi:hypothetical protein
MAAAEAGDIAAAEAALRDAIERFPGSIGPVLGMTRLLISTDRGDAALDLLCDSIRVRPHVELALALLSVGKELGRDNDALQRLDLLAEQTGDPRLKAAAAGLKQQQVSTDPDKMKPDTSSP